MSITLKECMSELRQHYPTCTDAIALAMVRQALDDLCDEYAISVATNQISIVAGQSKYLLPETWSGLRSVAYRPDSEPESAVELLWENDVEDRDLETTLWRFARSATPERAMFDAGYLVLYPPPDLTTSSGYPHLDVEATVKLTTAPQAALPSTIRNTEAIVYLASWRYAVKHDHSAVQMWMGMRDEALERLAHVAAKRNRRRRPQNYPESYYQVVT